VPVLDVLLRRAHCIVCSASRSEPVAVLGEGRGESWLKHLQAEHVLGYLGRYTHRVAISNGRSVNVTASTVTFRTKEGKTHSLTPVELLRRFIQHVLPDGFKKIRHYGLYASGVDDKLAVARARLASLGASAPTARALAPTWQQLLRELTGRDIDRCQRCGGAHRADPRRPPDRTWTTRPGGGVMLANLGRRSLLYARFGRDLRSDPREPIAPASWLFVSVRRIAWSIARDGVCFLRAVRSKSG
jgi:hypothetical protein